MAVVVWSDHVWLLLCFNLVVFGVVGRLAVIECSEELLKQVVECCCPEGIREGNLRKVKHDSAFSL